MVVSIRIAFVELESGHFVYLDAWQVQAFKFVPNFFIGEVSLYSLYGQGDWFGGSQCECVVLDHSTF